jgi:hypothetical protein
LHVIADGHHHQEHEHEDHHEDQEQPNDDVDVTHPPPAASTIDPHPQMDFKDMGLSNSVRGLLTSFDILPIGDADIDAWLRSNGFDRAKNSAVTGLRKAIVRLLDPIPFQSYTTLDQVIQHVHSHTTYQILDDDTKLLFVAAVEVTNKLKIKE